MSRKTEILKYVDNSRFGIEIAPYFRPLLSKTDGNKILVLDVFDTKSLREMAQKDPHISDEWIKNIEDVDIVGDASSIGDYASNLNLSGKLSYVISSHNFEHLPNPIKFLQGCASALESGGVLSMAVPDCRACFDHFRTPTRLSDWLLAYHQDIKMPSPETLFDFHANNCAYISHGQPTVGCDISQGELQYFVLQGDLKSAYSDYLSNSKNQVNYKDAHCTVMFPETLELLLRDCIFLGLIDFEIVEISKTVGLEFYVHLRKSIKTEFHDEKLYKEKRQLLLRSINSNLGSAPYLNFEGNNFKTNKMKKIFSSEKIKRFLNVVFGEKLYNKIRVKNKKRLAKRRT